MTFVATDTEVVQLCAQYTTSHGSGETCFATTHTQVPPQEVIDAIGRPPPPGDPVEPPLCQALALLNGTYGPIVIKPGTGGGSDIYVNGDLWYDCPSYEP